MTEAITVDQYKEWQKTGQLPTPAKEIVKTDAPDTSKHTHRFAGLDRGRVSTRGRMNKSEQKWSEELEALRLSGVVRRWWFGPMRLRLTDPAPGQRAVYFTADFLVELSAGPVFVDDVKGGMVNDAAIVRIKTAATKFPLWTFRLVHRVKRSEGGWRIVEL